ncbi:MAG: hypothetical protein JSV50_20835 [Desulfobacteraceae bacterium]|nr:MAG: hypothetical protein JSV50_20835 [Desulfobacteraceae bacterium]
MKSSIKTLFVLLAIVMSFVTVQAVLAERGLECDEVVRGEVTDIRHVENAIVVDGDTVVYGIPVEEWDLDIEIKDSIVINANMCLDGKLVACYLTVNGGDIIDLRPRSIK